MEELRDRVAVVTGAASGIGFALAQGFADAGMNVVLADVEEGALADAASRVAARATVLAVPTDVSDAAAVEALAQRTLARFGAVHVLCNNAGVSVGGPMWEHTLADWQWVFGVNFWGVVHGIRSFVPRMIDQAVPAHVVNTASLAGLTTAPFLGVYNATKHAVVALSETLAQELALVGAPVKVSVLCPGFVRTNILDSARNRPAALSAGAERARPEQFEQAIRSAIADGLPPADVAAAVVDAVRQERFYVLPHPGIAQDRVRRRLEGILQNRTPAPDLAPR